ncbi:MAG: IS701 family transposase [Gammaproteobacteria bacterium]|nr:IS701 family transposase [Gammaproteobacteria bacterium]
MAEVSGVDAAFGDYMGALSAAMGVYRVREKGLYDYCTGLLLDVSRKSVEPIAAQISRERVSAKHQSLLHFVGQSEWCGERLIEAVSAQVFPSMEKHEKVCGWIIDDTGFVKKGVHSVGVGRQYCGQVGKKENCQIAVSLSVANHDFSLPVAFQLYLPKDWAQDDDRRNKAGVPETIEFLTKPQIALQQLKKAKEQGISPGVILADPAYGTDTQFRTQITNMGMEYAVGVRSDVSIWLPGTTFAIPANYRGQGRPSEILKPVGGIYPVSVKQFALGLKPTDWQTITWREGSNNELTSRFARARIRIAHRHHKQKQPRPEEWLLIEWPEDEDAPIKYWLSSLPEQTGLKELVDTVKLRWRIERDYLELKQEVGLNHYEGRGWRGFHHHVALCIAAYGFLICQQAAFPPSGANKTWIIAQFAFSKALQKPAATRKTAKA